MTPTMGQSVREQMGRNYGRLRRVGTEVVETLARAEPGARVAAEDELAEGIAAHLEIEETYMLPLIEERRPDEASALRADHDRIRTLLAELRQRGTGARRHEAAEALVQLLDAHASREEGVLYRWADALLGAGERAAVLRRLEESARARRS